jgi:hypothetical protein
VRAGQWLDRPSELPQIMLEGVAQRLPMIKWHMIKWYPTRRRIRFA